MTTLGQKRSQISGGCCKPPKVFIGTLALLLKGNENLVESPP
jgi:hypothetical protein